ncbi:3-methyl-2-oxobutanoate hydroxymethyltransferase [Terrimicrobium sacchariphilum]|uniref:3-methyl-2-oxobutanoate hydroxymethyltransferase n=2 Tax=Terrimicrobium sacchariphilum TaxID=690879 RepID=A0A146GAY1_TERSA|nr:3-methyl-2-oxobutanoate hydroxymethyltransferase [Terrimicrobium sacchariphilum]
MGRLLDDMGLDLILVGDSLGMVVLGMPDTTGVTIDHMVHHTAAVGRGVTQTLLVGDLSADAAPDPKTALTNARRLTDAGAKAVKIEGGIEVLPIVRALLDEHIPVLGHLGMLPQRVKEEGGYRIKGKTDDQARRLLEDAEALALAGVFGIVLELVTPPVAEQLSRAIPVPTIGIGSGEGCDGQILVTYDLLGMFPWFTPKFVKPKINVASQIQTAVKEFIDESRKPKP